MFIDVVIAVILGVVWTLIIAIATAIQILWIALHAIFRTDRHKQRRERIAQAHRAKRPNPTVPQPDKWQPRTPAPPPPPRWEDRMGQ